MEPSIPFTGGPIPGRPAGGDAPGPVPGAPEAEFVADLQGKLRLAIEALNLLAQPVSRIMAASFLQQIGVPRYDPDKEQDVIVKTSLAQLLAELNDNVLELAAIMEETNEHLEKLGPRARRKSQD